MHLPNRSHTVYCCFYLFYPPENSEGFRRDLKLLRNKFNEGQWHHLTLFLCFEKPGSCESMTNLHDVRVSLQCLFSHHEGHVRTQRRDPGDGDGALIVVDLGEKVLKEPLAFLFKRRRATMAEIHLFEEGRGRRGHRGRWIRPCCHYCHSSQTIPLSFAWTLSFITNKENIFEQNKNFIFN